MSYTIAVPASSVQKVLTYGIPSITSVSGGVSVANTTITSSYPNLPTVADPAYAQANVATGIATAGYNQANTATDLAYTVWAFANTIGGGSAIDNVARQIAISASSNTIIIQGVDNTQNTWISTNNEIQAGINATQNTRLQSIETINSNQNTSISIIQGVDVTQNTRLQSIETINTNQNTSISIIQGVDNTQNTTITAVNNYAVTSFARANTSANLFFGTSGSAFATGGITTLTSTNGVTIVGSANTLTINTPQNLRTTDSPTFNGLTLTNALAISQGGTSATSAAQALTNLLPGGAVSGYVLTTGGPGTFYWAASAGGGGGGTTPGTTISSTRLTYTGNGVTTAYTTPTYIPGASQLRIYFDGVRQFASTYTETNSTTVTFTIAPPSGVVILIEVDGYINNPYYANNITFTAPFGSIVAGANTIQLAIQDLETRKAALASPSFTGIATSTTPSTDTSNTQIATTAFVKNSLNNSNTYTHSISGNAGTVTNGVYTSGDQTIGGTKTFSSTISGSINGNAGTVTNGVYTVGDQTIGGTKTFSSTISGSINGNAGTVTNGVYTNGSYSNPSWITSLDGSKITGGISGNAGTVTNGVYTSSQQIVKAWAWWSASGGSVSSVTSYNVSSITRIGVGQFTIAYSTALPSLYASVASTGKGSPGSDDNVGGIRMYYPGTTSIQIGTGNSGFTAFQDNPYNSFIAIG